MKNNSTLINPWMGQQYIHTKTGHEMVNWTCSGRKKFVLIFKLVIIIIKYISVIIKVGLNIKVFIFQNIHNIQMLS